MIERAQSASWGRDLPLPPELRENLTRGRLELIRGADEGAVPVRIYGGEGGKTPVLLIHGLQSHSGWFAQSAAFLGSLGHPTYAADRRGSGLSPAPRGDVKDWRAWSADIRHLADEVSNRHGRERLYVLGHCFGAIPAALFAAENPERVRGAIFTSPALYTRISLPRTAVVKILLTLPGERNYPLPVPLQTGWFTDLPDFECFIGADPLALREATGDFYWQLFRARRHLQKNPGRLTMPIWVGTAGSDPVADNGRNLAWISQLPSSRKMLVRYENARHVLEFSRERERFFQDLAAWLGWMEDL